MLPKMIQLYSINNRSDYNKCIYLNCLNKFWKLLQNKKSFTLFISLHKFGNYSYHINKIKNLTRNELQQKLKLIQYFEMLNIFPKLFYMFYTTNYIKNSFIYIIDYYDMTLTTFLKCKKYKKYINSKVLYSIEKKIINIVCIIAQSGYICYDLRLDNFIIKFKINDKNNTLSNIDIKMININNILLPYTYNFHQCTGVFLTDYKIKIRIQFMLIIIQLHLNFFYNQINFRVISKYLNNHVFLYSKEFYNNPIYIQLINYYFRLHLPQKFKSIIPEYKNYIKNLKYNNYVDVIYYSYYITILYGLKKKNNHLLNIILNNL